LASIDSFIKGDNLRQALECTEKILKNIVKEPKPESMALGSNIRPCSSRQTDISVDSKAASSGFKVISFLYFLFDILYVIIE